MISPSRQQSRDTAVFSAKRQFVRFQKPLLYPAQHAGVRENRDGLSVVLRGNFVQSLQKPTGIAVPRLTACYLPDALVVVKIVHIRLVEALEPAERHILPAADARFPEPPVRVERQPFGNIHRLCGPARPVEVACIAGVDRNIFKARPQRFDLPHTVFRNQRIVLSVHPPVGIAFRFGSDARNKLLSFTSPLYSLKSVFSFFPLPRAPPAVNLVRAPSCF